MTNFLKRLSMLVGFAVLALIVGVVIISFIAPDKTQSNGASPSGNTTPALKIGDAFKTSNLEIKITRVEVRDTVGRTWTQSSAADGGIFVAVAYNYRNITQKPVGTNPIVRLKSPDGIIYDPDIDASIGFRSELAANEKVNEKILSDLNPGIQVNGAEVFEVNKASFNPDTWKILVKAGGDFEISIAKNIPQGEAKESVPSKQGNDAAAGTISDTASAASSAWDDLEAPPKSVLEKYYAEYDKAHDCWIAVNQDQPGRYCMKIDRKDKVIVESNPRYYLLMVGHMVDEDGNEASTHAASGLVGAFVFEVNSGVIKMLAASPSISIGENGQSPADWELVKLGPADYWGWKNIDSGGNMGCMSSRYSILAPYGTGIKDLSDISAGFDDAGACTDQNCQSTSIDSKLQVDSTSGSEKLYPLTITISGKAKGKSLEPKKWMIPFDSKKWKYVTPANWPIKVSC